MKSKISGFSAFAANHFHLNVIPGKITFGRGFIFFLLLEDYIPTFESNFIKLNNAMKKVLLISVIMLFVTNGMYAQAKKLYTHLAYSQIIYPFYNYSDYKNDGSYQMDLNLTYYLNPKFGISTGIGYELKKFQFDYQGNNLNGWERDKELFEFEYLNFPIQVEFKLIEKRTNNLSIRTGIEFCKLLSKKRTVLHYNGQMDDGFDDYEIDKMITNVSLALNYRYLFWKNYFVSVSPMLRYNATSSQGIHGNHGQGTAFSYIFEIALGYKLATNSPIIEHK